MYLAGKVGGRPDRDGADWRASLVDHDVLERSHQEVWAPAKDAIKPGVHFTGPFLGPGENHDFTMHQQLSEFDTEPAGLADDRRGLFTQCTKAIAGSDIVFAWLTDLTAFGTLFELGVAHSLGVPVYVAIPDSKYKEISKHLWFALTSAKGVEAAYSDPASAFLSVLRWVKRERTEQAAKEHVR